MYPPRRKSEDPQQPDRPDRRTAIAAILLVAGILGLGVAPVHADTARALHPHDHRYACDRSDRQRYDTTYGQYERIGYDYQTGTWHSCESDESYEHSMLYSHHVRTGYTNSYSSMYYRY